MNPDEMLKIATQIRGIMLEDNSIVEMVGSKIFPARALKDTEGDFILYELDAVRCEFTKMGICETTGDIYINTISDNFDRSQELACRVYQCLAGFHTDPKMEVRFIEGTIEIVDEKFFHILLFNIK